MIGFWCLQEKLQSSEAGMLYNRCQIEIDLPFFSLTALLRFWNPPIQKRVSSPIYFLWLNHNFTRKSDNKLYRSDIGIKPSWNHLDMIFGASMYIFKNIRFFLLLWLFCQHKKHFVFLEAELSSPTNTSKIGGFEGSEESKIHGTLWLVWDHHGKGRCYCSRVCLIFIISSVLLGHSHMKYLCESNHSSNVAFFDELIKSQDQWNMKTAADGVKLALKVGLEKLT